MKPSEADSSSQLSFRDPEGSVYFYKGRVLRSVRKGCPFQELMQSKPIRDLIAETKWIQTYELSPEESAQSKLALGLGGGDVDLFEHPRLDFVSYPFEWSPAMLADAGLLTLEIFQRLQAENMGLKDASAYNILFTGARPIFIDALSVEKRTPGDPVWLAYTQFSRHFVLPLLACASLKVELKTLLTGNREGLEPEKLYSWLGLRSPFSSLALEHVRLPVWLKGKAGRSKSLYAKPSLRSEAQARFILDRQMDRLKRQVSQLSKRCEMSSHWSEYAGDNSYSDPASQQKKEFVERIIQEHHPAWVLDLGSNTGVFSEIAAHAQSQVLAVDSDEASIDRLYRKHRDTNSRILPLVVHLANPTPAQGWMNQESTSWIERTQERFDLVMALALIHHLLITDRIPLASIIDFIHSRSRRDAIIEYVGPSDAMFKSLLRGRDELHADFNLELFERELSKKFKVLDRKKLVDLDRVLFLVRRRDKE